MIVYYKEGEFEDWIVHQLQYFDVYELLKIYEVRKALKDTWRQKFEYEYGDNHYNLILSKEEKDKLREDEVVTAVLDQHSL